MHNLMDESLSKALSIVQSINTKRILRKKLDENEVELLTQLLSKVIAKGLPLPFVMLWGAGRRKAVGCWEEYAVRQLRKLDERINLSWTKGMLLDIIYADVHGKMNRLPEESIVGYYESLSHFFRKEAPFVKRFIRLSDLWNHHGMNSKTIESMRQESSKYESHPCYRHILENTRAHYQGANEREGALEYIATRLSDKRLLIHFFAGYIQLTYNHPGLSFLQPALFTLYIWSLKKGTNLAPWYLSNKECR